MDQQTDSHKIYIPLLGVRCNVEDFLIAGFRFIHIDDDVVEVMKKEAKAMFADVELTGPSREFVAEIEKTIDALDDTSALVRESSESYSAARKDAFDRAQDAVSFLRLFSAFVFSEVEDPVIDYVDNFAFSFRNPYHLAMSPRGVYAGFQRRSDRGILILSDEQIQKIYAIGLDQLLKMMEPGANLTTFDQIILEAVRWFSSASVPMRPENRLLNYVTCLEMFLSRSNVEIAQSVSEGAAMMIADDLANRVRIAGEVKKFYSERSAVTHSGTQLVSPERVLYLKNITARFIVAVLARRSFFEKRDDFLDYLRDQRLSSQRKF